MKFSITDTLKKSVNVEKRFVKCGKGFFEYEFNMNTSLEQLSVFGN